MCFLPATHNLRIISSEFDSNEESEIIITICSGCNEEIYEDIIPKMNHEVV